MMFIKLGIIKFSPFFVVYLSSHGGTSAKMNLSGNEILAYLFRMITLMSCVWLMTIW